MKLKCESTNNEEHIFLKAEVIYELHQTQFSNQHFSRPWLRHKFLMVYQLYLEC